MNKEITIIGAGPSGLSAAINLAKHNYAVTVIDSRPEVGMRLNGDFQGLENWTLKEDVLDDLRKMNIKVNFFCEPKRGGEFYGPNGKRAATEVSRPLFYLIKRGRVEGSLDLGLKKQALDCGVKIKFGQTISPEQADIIASGPKRVDAFAAGYIFKTDLEDKIIGVLNNKLAPSGYAYLLTHRGEGTLATCIFREFNRAELYLEKTLKYFQGLYDFEMRGQKRFSGYGNFSINASAIRNGKLFVGEAAGFQDYLWGFGIHYALISGYLAAKSIVENRNFDRLWKDRLLPQLRKSVVNRFLFSKLGDYSYNFIIKKIDGNKKVRELLRRHYNMTALSGLAFPFINYFFGRPPILKR